MEKSSRACQVVLIPVSKIIDNPNQPRTSFDQKEIGMLSNSIQNMGLLQPIGVRELDQDRFEVVFGSRRLMSFRQLGREEIPAIIIKEGNSAVISLLENIQRQDLSLRDEACAFRRIIDAGELSQGQLGERVGRHKSFVSRMVRIGERVEECGDKVSFTELKRSVYFELLEAPVELLVTAEEEYWNEDKARQEMQNLGKVKKRHRSESRRTELYISESMESQSSSLLPVSEDPGLWVPVEGDSVQGFTIYPFRFRKGSKVNMEALIEKLSELQRRIGRILEDLRADKQEELLKSKDDTVVLPLNDGAR
jgi:ParB family chromosome partitioning protein